MVFSTCRKVCIHLGAGVSSPHYVAIRSILLFWRDYKAEMAECD
eukprot:s824_g11.t1